MRLAFGIFLILHGFAHLVGFVVPWRLMSNAEMPYKTTLLAGHWDVGDVGIRITGIIWLVAAVAFLFAGIGVIRQSPWDEMLGLSVTVGSFIMCILSWPEARIGVFVNVAIVLGLLLLKKFLPN